MKRRCPLMLLVLVAVVVCAEDAAAQLTPLWQWWEGMVAEPASPEDGMQHATKQLIAARCNVIAQLQQEMQQASSAMKFEEAARLCEAIHILTQGAAPKGHTLTKVSPMNGWNLCPSLCPVPSLSLSRLEPVSFPMSCDSLVSLSLSLRREIRSV